jgi:hypothetical protein
MLQKVYKFDLKSFVYLAQDSYKSKSVLSFFTHMLEFVIFIAFPLFSNSLLLFKQIRSKVFQGMFK